LDEFLVDLKYLFLFILLLLGVRSERNIFKFTSTDNSQDLSIACKHFQQSSLQTPLKYHKKETKTNRSGKMLPAPHKIYRTEKPSEEGKL